MNRFTIPEGWAEGRVSILLVGVGGTGSQVADQLASLEASLKLLGHPGFKVRVVDGDKVDRPNCGRQRFTLTDIGINKGIILCHRINAFYGLDWEPDPSYLSPRPTGSLHYDLIITCTDSASFRATLGAHHRNRKTETIWLDYGNGDASGQAIIGHLGKPEGVERLPNVFDLYPELADMTTADAEQPSCSTEEAMQRQPWPVNREIAMKGMTLLWQLFREGHIDHHGVQMGFKPLSLTLMPICPDAWAFYGYQHKKLRRPKPRAKAVEAVA